MNDTLHVVQPFWKPVDWTSFDVIRRIRRLTKIRKVGHAGTLDPFAEGVLVLCFGSATKLTAEIMTWKKEYMATVTLGTATDTLDRTGRVIERMAVPTVSLQEVENVSESFVGTIMQVPPMYSALRVGGKRLYELARAGQQIERDARPVEIYEMEVVDWCPPEQLGLRISCGKGTYIRVL
ncbi:tRNA pseudouridine(55) synthase TruB, partial [Candidatus Neomarinimicrobiota bacterium]